MDYDEIVGRVKGEKRRKLKPKIKRKRRKLDSSFIGKEVLLTEHDRSPYFCTILGVGEEGDQVVYVVEAGGKLFTVFTSHVRRICLRSQVKVLELNSLNLDPLKVILGFN